MTFKSSIVPRLRRLWHGLRLAILLTAVLFTLGGAAVPPGGLLSGVRGLTRPIEFDYGSWTLDAALAKLSGWALSLNRFLSPEDQSRVVLETLSQVRLVNALEAEVLLIYAYPAIADPDAASQSTRASLQKEQARLDTLAPVAESILQAQLIDILQGAGLDMLGGVIPPSLFKTSDVPYSLVVSPRDEIIQALDVSLLPEITTETMDKLETRIFNDLDHAALVVPIGGIGTYPTMVRQTTDIVWLTEVIAHEWIHNFLTLRPLGINYYTNAELRTINETTASLAGEELGQMILQKYYPDFVPPEAEPAAAESTPPPEEIQSDPNAFDFRAEMRITRVEVDRLLAEGEIEAAESYMETRRQFFWDNGYLIRKLNQAYFAFHGAYNDDPGGGASGEDPVGPAVVAFRAQFEELADFLKTIAWVNSFDDLLRLLSG
ncbi:MAG: hypothetical protein U9R53_09300 [Chloroflexota bacterium]|nr:hypothetical protein [Chloroflexota bacterium]